MSPVFTSQLRAHFRGRGEHMYESRLQAQLLRVLMASGRAVADRDMSECSLQEGVFMCHIGNVL